MKPIPSFFTLSLLRACFLLSFITIITACAASPEATPTPYPDTPAPAEIDAPLVELPALISIQFLSELDGWGVTETQIVRTNDGGITWYDVTPPEVSETGYSVDTFVLDNTHVWIQVADAENFPNGGALYRTTDGGLTWNSNKVPFSRGDLNFLDPNNGWVMSALGVAAGSMGVSVFQTSDGGKTWDQTYTNDPNLTDAGESLPLGGIKSDLTPLDMQTAWVGGVIYAPGTVYLYRTDDAGKNWMQITLPLPTGAENFELSIDEDQMQFLTASDGFIALRMSGDLTQTAVYVTDDAGDTWSLTPTLIAQAGSSEFLSANEAVIYNGEQFYVTRDATRTWSIIPPDVLFGESFAGMDFVNMLSGWVITVDPTTNHRALYRTSDGGATWFPVIP